MFPAPKNKLIARANIIDQIRQFFVKRSVLEVDTPILSPAAVTDPHLASFKTHYIPSGTDERYPLYLQTSPEFAMKRLLANGSGDIYQICKSFRNGEKGHLHSPEFMMLEWYRLGFDHHQLMDEVDALLRHVLDMQLAKRRTYAEIFLDVLSINPHEADIAQLQQCARAYDLTISGIDSKDTWLAVLFSHCIEPKLGMQQPDFIYDYPVSQAMLAKIKPGRPSVAERFEVYVKGIELANGFHELTDAKEQKKRFEADLVIRKKHGLEAPPMDTDLLKALEYLPPCSGVALGIDRLIMIATEANSI